MSTEERDETLIRQVNALAAQSAGRGFAPFAALLVDADGAVVATSPDRCIEYADPTAHAELTLISEYCREQGVISLEGHTLYCNVEPCVMCSGAIHWAKLARVVYGVSQSMLQSVSTGKEKPGCRELINTGKQQVEVRGPVLPEEGLRVLRQHPFRSKQRMFQDYRNHRPSAE